MKDLLVEKVAQAMYSQVVTIPRWSKEQQSMRTNYIGMARSLIDALDANGLEVVEKSNSKPAQKKAIEKPKAAEGADVDKKEDGK